MKATPGAPTRVTAAELGDLLEKYAVPLVVLNACQSAMLQGGADNPIASIATGMLSHGVPAVVAMAYSLYVRGAQAFLPAFYQTLFASGDVVEAVRCGR